MIVFPFVNQLLQFSKAHGSKAVVTTVTSRYALPEHQRPCANFALHDSFRTEFLRMLQMQTKKHRKNAAGPRKQACR
jgi:PP-loop superfamily ATP-utilizing enzyme